MASITLALDWTPNINHIGFFIAQELGYYKEYGLQVSITDPSEDNYSLTPAKKVELGLADFALCPTESTISYQTKSSPFKLIAVAAVLQQDLSAIVVKADSGISSPKDLDGKVYASYEARYEDEIVRQLVRNDGGSGDIKLSYPNKLEIWDELLNDKVDATWIFLNWEGVHVEQSDYKMNYFSLAEFNVPYSYSPVIAANEAMLKTKKSEYKAFIQATQKAYLYACENPESAAKMFRQYVPSTDSEIDLLAALKMSIDAFTDQGRWGYIDQTKVSIFLDWLHERKLELVKLAPEEIATNVLFE
ncbi:ABC transporter substrate-binding protein [Glaciecola sp. MH2013]|uniref:ABC transporter substrate-binding protein n=1 Tax=Glaciecola sp. MH2013 TaxID=2785524 RepID=UPI00189EA0EC|nr:ABC transporter substrate-binding protein [Glaciecola sp. MH2013]MBF7073020.1 ABC transporter substrate-binding protein [Glaciecola sp. MH2013]